jgi:hypothetical protein
LYSSTENASPTVQEAPDSSEAVLRDAI